MELVKALKAQMEANEVFRIDLNNHIEELLKADVIDLMKLCFAWGNYYHWQTGMGVRGQANQIEGWLIDMLWEEGSDDWFEIKAFIIDTSEYLNDEDNFFELTGKFISETSEFQRKIFMRSYQRFGEYIRRALAELNHEDAYVINLVNTLAQFWVEWYAANAKDIANFEMGPIENIYDAIQGNLREVMLGRSEAALDETYALKAD